MGNHYSKIKTVTVERFRVARYVIISPNPENDVINYMETWAKKSGLLNDPNYVPKRIGWDFPYVSEEQQKQFGLRGYVCAYIIPEDFQPKCEGAELTYIETDNYAMITITDPFSAPFEIIPNAYKTVFSYIQNNGLEIKNYENRICFEKCYENEGITYMDVYIPIDK